VGLPAGTLFHPTFLYEILWNVVGIAVILLLERRLKLQWGTVFAAYLIWYGIGRSVFETIRTDPSLLFAGIRTNVWMSLLAVVLGVVIIGLALRRHTGRQPSPYVPGRAPGEADDEVRSEDVYAEDDDLEPVAAGSSAHDGHDRTDETRS